MGVGGFGRQVDGRGLFGADEEIGVGLGEEAVVDGGKEAVRVGGEVDLGCLVNDRGGGRGGPTLAMSPFRLSTAPMKEGFWWEKPLCSWRAQVLVSM